MSRYHLMTYGMLALMIGVQLLVFDSFILTEDASKAYYEFVERNNAPDFREVNRVVSSASTVPFVRKVITYPSWLGWPFVSVGAVLVFQSFILRRD